MSQCYRCGRALPPFSFKKVCQWCVQHERAQRGELPEDAKQRVEVAPWLRQQSAPSRAVTQLIFGINAAVFLGMALAGISINNPPVAQLIHWGANFGPLTLGGQPWRLLTSAFVHSGILHIGINMWCLWDLGSLAESLYGRWTFALVYLACAIGGSIASVSWHPAVTSVGASGAIFGIAGALVASFYLGEFSMPRIAIQSTLRSIVIFIGYSLVFGAIGGRTDNACHMGGLITGLLFGAAIAKLAPDRDNVFSRTAVLLGVMVLVFGSGQLAMHSRAYIVHFQRGEDFLEANKYDLAIAELQTAVRLKPSFPDAHYDLAGAYYKKSQYSQAEAEFRRYIELAPDDPSGWYELGFVYLDQQKFQQSSDCFHRVLNMSPRSSGGHFGLALVMAAEGKHAEALPEFQQAIDLRPSSAAAYYYMGVSYAKLNRLDEAIAAYKKVRDIAGDDYDTEVALASVYQAKGLTQQAEEARKKAEQLKSND